MIWLVRHGESDWNAAGVRHGRDDRPLTPAGAAQAWAAGKQLARLADPLIVCSPLQRARDTAEIIAIVVGARRVRTLDGLIERPYDGGWLESCADAGERAAYALDPFNMPLIAVTHAGILKGLLGLGKTPPNGSVHRWR